MRCPDWPRDTTFGFYQALIDIAAWIPGLFDHQLLLFFSSTLPLYKHSKLDFGSVKTMSCLA